MAQRCPFTEGECDGGVAYSATSLGCGFKESPGEECDWIAELPETVSPRDFYNAAMMEAMLS